MDKALFDRLEAMDEIEVLREIALSNRHGTQDSELRSQVEACLRVKEIERANSAAAMEREALRIARSAKRIAIAQIVVSTITAIVAVVIGALLSRSS